MIIHRDELEACIAGKIGEPHTFPRFTPFGRSPRHGCKSMGSCCSKDFLVHDNDSQTWELIKVDQRGFFELHLAKVDSHFHYSLLFVYEGNQKSGRIPTRSIRQFSTILFSISTKGLIVDLLQNLVHSQRPIKVLMVYPFLWAPSAKSIHLVGDFNNWDSQSLPMRSLGSSGCHELFVPSAKVGDKYKFRVLGFDGILREKN